MRGSRQAHGLDVPAEGQRAAQPEHCHVEVSRVRVVGRVCEDLGHAGPHRAGLRAAELRGACVGHPLAGVLQPAGQTNGSSEAPVDRAAEGNQQSEAISGGKC